MSIPIEAPPETPGHVGHTPTPNVNLGMRLGRFHDLAGGIFGSGVVRAILGQPQSAGVPPIAARPEYALQPFGIPGRSDSRAKPPSPELQAAAHAHTLLSLEEASIKFQRSGRVNHSVPQQLRSLLDDYRTWKAPR
jgi:hypothetical protein